MKVYTRKLNIQQYKTKHGLHIYVPFRDDEQLLKAEWGEDDVVVLVLIAKDVIFQRSELSEKFHTMKIELFIADENDYLPAESFKYLCSNKTFTAHLFYSR